MVRSEAPKNVKCLGASAGSFFRQSCHHRTLVSRGERGLEAVVKWAVAEVSFKGMFNFHSLFLKSNFLQRQEE